MSDEFPFEKYFLLYTTLHALKRLYQRLKPHWGLAIAVGLVMGYFAPILLTGRVLSESHVLYNAFPWQAIYSNKPQIEYRHFGDVVDSSYPTIIFLLYWLKQGILPLWNPTVAGGQPFISVSFFR